MNKIKIMKALNSDKKLPIFLIIVISILWVLVWEYLS